MWCREYVQTLGTIGNWSRQCSGCPEPSSHSSSSCSGSCKMGTRDLCKQTLVMMLGVWNATMINVLRINYRASFHLVHRGLPKLLVVTKHKVVYRGTSIESEHSQPGRLACPSSQVLPPPLGLARQPSEPWPSGRENACWRGAPPSMFSCTLQCRAALHWTKIPRLEDGSLLDKIGTDRSCPVQRSQAMVATNLPPSSTTDSSFDNAGGM